MPFASVEVKFQSNGDNVQKPATMHIGYASFSASKCCCLSKLLSAFISMHNLLIQMMDFDQTCIGTLLGGGEEFIRLW